MQLIDVLIVLAFAAYAIYSGIRAHPKASENLEEYFLAGRSLTGWQAGISMAATQFAADTPLLVTGLIATAGIFSLWRLWIYALAFLLMGFLLAPSWRRANVLTDAELTEFRYSSRTAAWLRAAKAIYFGTIFNCTVLAMVLLAATRVAEPFLLWHQWLPAQFYLPLMKSVMAFGVPLTVAPDTAWDLWILSTDNLISIGALVLLTLFYSTTGGLRSVVATDFIQFWIAIMASFFFAWYVVDRAGGLAVIPNRIQELFAQGGPGGITPSEILAFTPSRAKEASITVLIVFGIQWLTQMNADGTGYLAQRSMACRTDHDARKATVVFTLAQILLRSLIWLPLGLGLLIVFPPDPNLTGSLLAADREATFVKGIAELLPPGLKGLMLVGMLAALASTVDTHLNWGSSYWTNDIFKRFVYRSWLKKEPSKQALVWIARASNVLILVIALLIMTQLKSIQTAWQTSLLLGAGIGIILVLRWIWWRINGQGEAAAIVASSLLAPTLIFLVPTESEAVRLLLMATGSTAVGIVVSLLYKPEDMEALKRFYIRVRPPGIWSPVARAAGIDPHEGRVRMIKALAATFIAAFSIFCLLTSIGSLIAGSPAPTWFQHRPLWIATLFILGIGLIPIWIRLGFKHHEHHEHPECPGTETTL